MTGKRSICPLVNSAKSLMAGWRSATSPWSSAGDISARAWVSHGKAALIVAGVSSTPGIISSAHARVDGNAAFRLSSAGWAAASVSGSSWMVWRRFPSCEASAAIVVLKFVIRSFSWTSRLASALKTRCWPLISFDRSCGWVPSVASFTIAAPRSASGA